MDLGGLESRLNSTHTDWIGTRMQSFAMAMLRPAIATLSRERLAATGACSSSLTRPVPSDGTATTSRIQRRGLIFERFSRWFLTGKAPVHCFRHNVFNKALNRTSAQAVKTGDLRPIEIGVTNRIDFPSPASQFPNFDVRFAELKSHRHKRRHGALCCSHIMVTRKWPAES